MKVLVTGAAGCIGSNLAEKLAKRGDEVIGVDNYNNYYDPAQKRANARRLGAYPNLRLIDADIRDRSRMQELFESEAIDAVAHLAGMGGVRNSIVYPDLYIDVNVNGTQAVLDAARLVGGVRGFVFASTSTVYGNTTQLPFVETDPCDRPLQPYAASKRASEILGHAYYYLYGINFTVLRFFTVYGPNNRPDMMAFLVAESITKGLPIPLYNGGRMYRDWTFVEDISDGIVAALDRPLGYEIFNLGRGEPTLLTDFIALLEQLSGRKANLIDAPMPTGEMERNYADSSKARRLLGYEPKVSVQAGVQAFWRWYISRASEAN